MRIPKFVFAGLILLSTLGVVSVISDAMSVLADDSWVYGRYQERALRRAPPRS